MQGEYVRLHPGYELHVFTRPLDKTVQHRYQHRKPFSSC